MGVIGVILLVAFIIICILLVCIVLIQNESGSGMGGLLGGGNSIAFGSRSGNVLTKTTYILVTLFFVSTIGLALLNKTNDVQPLSTEAVQTDANSLESWLDSASAEDAAGAAAETAADENAAAAETAGGADDGAAADTTAQTETAAQ